MVSNIRRLKICLRVVPGILAPHCVTLPRPVTTTPLPVKLCQHSAQGQCDTGSANAAKLPAVSRGAIHGIRPGLCTARPKGMARLPENELTLIASYLTSFSSRAGAQPTMGQVPQHGGANPHPLTHTPYQLFQPGWGSIRDPPCVLSSTSSAVGSYDAHRQLQHVLTATMRSLGSVGSQ